VGEVETVEPALPAQPSAIPRKIWLSDDAQLPRAPISAPKLIAAAIRSAGLARQASASARAALTVASMFEPVSPSGDRVDVEGVDLIDVRFEIGDAGEGIRAGVAVARGAPSGDVRAAVRRVRAWPSAS
jgi:hypothetical protein